MKCKVKKCRLPIYKGIVSGDYYMDIVKELAKKIYNSETLPCEIIHDRFYIDGSDVHWNRRNFIIKDEV